MNIGVAGPFNPKSVENFFDENIVLPNINIMATSVNNYVKGLLELGHKVTVFTTTYFSGKPYCIDGKNIRIYFISTKHSFNRAGMVNRIYQCIKSNLESLDILHAEWTYEFALACKPFNKTHPVFCTVRDWCPYIKSLAKTFKEKYYWTISYWMFKSVMKGDAIHFIANSDYTRKQIVTAYPNKNVNVIFNPLDSNNILEKRLIYPKNPVFISISTTPFSERKNNYILLKAFKKYKEIYHDASLIIVGNVPENIKIQLNNENLLQGVIFPGRISHDDVIKLIDQSSCLIHPALEETFGNILLEGMCRRVPCIGGNNSGAVPQVLGYGEYGILCNVTDENSILEAMQKVLKVDIFKKIVDHSTRYVTNTYKHTTIALQHIELFQTFITKNKL